MDRRRRPRSWAFRILLASAVALPVAATAAPPSFVVFLADDLGYSDLSSYGGEVATPAIDAIGREGARFRQFYATPRCSPTRAALLTGRHPHAAGMGHLADLPTGDPAYRGSLSPDVATLPERLRRAGYRSYMVGKWHLDASNDPASPGAPLGRGFDRFFGVMRGAEDFYRPASLARDRASLPVPPGDDYLTDRLAAEAAGFVRQHQAQHPDAPFFLYVAFTAPHWPVQAPAADLSAMDGLYADGWDRARERRAEGVRRVGALAGAWTAAKRDPQVSAWSEVEHAEWQRARMRAYAGALRAMDRGVATVLRAIDDAGRRGDTVVAFLSDNGGSPEELGRLSHWIRRAAGLFSWEHYGDDPSKTPGGPDSFQAYGRGWSAVSNAPFRGHKAGLYEGGIASPLLIRGPTVAGSAPDGWLDEPAHVTDLAATLLDWAGVAATGELDGRSLAPMLRGQPQEHAALFWEHEGWRAVRDGDLKAVAPPGGAWELYDLAADRTEQRNLASQRPDDVARLGARYEAWSDEVGVQSWPWVLPIVRRIALGGGVLAIGLVAGVAWAIVRRRRAP